MSLHDGQELDDDLGARSDKDLSLSGLLGVVDGVERIVEDGCLDHFGGVGTRFSDRSVDGCEVSANWGIWLAFKSHEHGECPSPMCLLGRVLPAQYWRGEAYQEPDSTIAMLV